MAKVLVMENPPRKGKTMKRKKRRASAAQLRALAKGRAALARKRAGKVSHKKRRRVHKKILRRRHVAVVKKRRIRRHKRAAIKNPFLSELALVGNPRRKHMKRRSHKRRHNRRHSRGLRLNPGGALAAVAAGPREMVSGEFVKEAASVAAGFILPNLIMPRLPYALVDQTWKVLASKVVVIAGVSAVAGMVVSRKAAKLVLLGGGVSILLSLYDAYVGPMVNQALLPAPHPATPSGTQAYFGNAGDPGVSNGYDLSSFYGNPGDPGMADSLADAFGS